MMFSLEKNISKVRVTRNGLTLKEYITRTTHKQKMAKRLTNG